MLGLVRSEFILVKTVLKRFVPVFLKEYLQGCISFKLSYIRLWWFTADPAGSAVPGACLAGRPCRSVSGSFQRQLWYHISDRLDCQALFLKFLRTFRFPFSSARPFPDGKWYNITSFFHMQVLFQEILKFFISDQVPILHTFPCGNSSYFRKKKLISRSSRKLTLGVLYRISEAEKEGFEPSRRFPDLHP